MRIRTIKPEWATDGKLNDAGDAARVLSVALITLCDDYGNCRGDIGYLVGQVWAKEVSRNPRETFAKASEALARLSKAGYLVIYESAGEDYCHLTHWQKHQKVDHPGKPRYPSYNPDLAKSSRDFREILAPDQDQDQDQDQEGTRTKDQDLFAGESGDSPPPTGKRLAKPKKSTAKSAATWRSYAEAYFQRYQVAPTRNARINGQLAQFIQRVPLEDAPHVARAYVQNNNKFYASNAHAVGYMLRDAEKLHMEYQRGRPVTRGDAAQAEKADEMRAQSSRVEQILEGWE